MGACVLVLLLACTAGEAPPAGPAPGPAGGGVEETGGAALGGAGSGAVDARAAELLAGADSAYGAGALEEALRLARQIVADHAGTTAEAGAFWIGARAAFSLGRYDEARRLAVEYEGVAPTDGAGEARSLVELADDALAVPAPVTIGAVLPRSGPRVLVRYADWVLEGIELAVAEAERVQNRRIELIVADDSGGIRVRQAVRELERRGAVAIVGPLLTQDIDGAARARTSDDLVLVSPTASETPRWPETYSINSTDPRGARELGRYAADLGLVQAAVLYPRITEFERKARAFADEFEAFGGTVQAMVPYDSGTTTFATHMRRVLEAVAPDTAAAPVDSSLASARFQPTRPQEPFALFVAAPPRDVPQIAPQVAFYGLDSAGVQVVGDEAWASAAVRRVVPNRDLEGVIAASPFPPERADAAADPDFVEAYETRYRRSLDNQLPALGYDAAHLVMQALPNRLTSPRAFARRFHLLAGIRGATGLLSVRENRVVRTPYIVVIRNGELAPAPFPWEYEMPEPKPPLPTDSTDGGGSR